jgi:hypothetical protein
METVINFTSGFKPESHSNSAGKLQYVQKKRQGLEDDWVAVAKTFQVEWETVLNRWRDVLDPKTSPSGGRTGKWTKRIHR